MQNVCGFVVGKVLGQVIGHYLIGALYFYFEIKCYTYRWILPSRNHIPLYWAVVGIVDLATIYPLMVVRSPDFGFTGAGRGGAGTSQVCDFRSIFDTFTQFTRL